MSYFRFPHITEPSFTWGRRRAAFWPSPLNHTQRTESFIILTIISISLTHKIAINPRTSVSVTTCMINVGRVLSYCYSFLVWPQVFFFIAEIFLWIQQHYNLAASRLSSLYLLQGPPLKTPTHESAVMAERVCKAKGHLYAFVGNPFESAAEWELTGRITLL